MLCCSGPIGDTNTQSQKKRKKEKKQTKVVVFFFFLKNVIRINKKMLRNLFTAPYFVCQLHQSRDYFFCNIAIFLIEHVTALYVGTISPKHDCSDDITDQVHDLGGRTWTLHFCLLTLHRHTEFLPLRNGDYFGR